MRAIGPAALWAALLLAAGCEPPLPEAQGRYEDPGSGYSIEFPQGWKLRQEAAEGILVALSPREGQDDPFSENVTIHAARLPEPRALDEHFEVLLGEWRRSPGFEQLEAGRRELGGAEARWIVQQQEVQGEPLRLLTYVIVVNQRSYIIHCAAPPETFAQVRPIFERAVGTFRILEEPAAAPGAAGPPNALGS